MHKLEFAEYLQTILLTHPMVYAVTLHGSLSRGNFDTYSDINLEVFVKDYDHGKVLLQLPEFISQSAPVLYADFNIEQIPSDYIVRIGFLKEVPFLVAEIHVSGMRTESDIKKKDIPLNKATHTLSCWMELMKLHLREIPVRKQVERLAGTLFDRSLYDSCSEREIMLMVEDWLLRQFDEELKQYVLQAHQEMRNVKLKEREKGIVR